MNGAEAAIVFAQIIMMLPQVVIEGIRPNKDKLYITCKVYTMVFVKTTILGIQVTNL